jgi:3''-phosphoadenosine 5''-phosphosulfate sulfotransferase (PAPS reductase)/FAD synthetase and related enzymes
MPYCELYDKGFDRIGCLFCPMARPKIKQLEREMYPGVERAYKRAIQDVIDRKGYYQNLDCDADRVFDWWTSNLTVAEFLKREQNGKG